MPRFIVERSVPGAGLFTAEHVRSFAEKMCEALPQAGPGVYWIQGYVAEDKIYGLYVAPDKESLVRHAERAGVPADRISRVAWVIDPASAEG